MTKRSLFAVAMSIAVAAGCGGHSATVLVSQSGKIVALGTTTGISEVTVAGPGATTTTDADGAYSIGVPRNAPYELVLSGSGYYKTILQRWAVAADIDRGRTNLVSEAQWEMLMPAISKIGGTVRDPALGLVALLVTALPSCATTGGANVTVAPSDPSTRYVYAGDNGAPSTNTSTSAAPLPAHVLIYNVPPGSVAITIASPVCRQAPFPVMAAVSAGGWYTDTGDARVEPGSVVSYLRVYLEQ